MSLNTWQNLVFSQLKKAEELVNRYCHTLSSSKNTLICIWCFHPHFDFGFGTLSENREAEMQVLWAEIQR